jgi:hypothetical protein
MYGFEEHDAYPPDVNATVDNGRVGTETPLQSGRRVARRTGLVRQAGWIRQLSVVEIDQHHSLTNHYDNDGQNTQRGGK